jgi:hypothetical protein
MFDENKFLTNMFVEAATLPVLTARAAFQRGAAWQE